jgi:ABC-type antimicrobial peptide transport system permease subunit
LSGSSIGYIYIGVTLSGLLGFFSHRLTHKLGPMTAVSILFGAAVTACVILAAVINAWLSVAAVVLLRIAFSLFQPLQTELQNKQVVTQNRATELSINALLIDSVGIGTNLVYGKLADIDLPAAMLTGAFLCLAGYLCVLLWSFRYFKHPEAHR